MTTDDDALLTAISRRVLRFLQGPGAVRQLLRKVQPRH